MKTYRGYRGTMYARDGTVVHTACWVEVEDPDEAEPYLLPPRYDLRRHSPTGYEWGYSGSGPAQLALALCADVIQLDERALQLYMGFKREVVVSLARDGWTLTEADVLLVLNALWMDRQHEEVYDDVQE